jgi:hypothetical protein
VKFELVDHRDDGSAVFHQLLEMREGLELDLSAVQS